MILNPVRVPYFWELSSNARINYYYCYFYLIICLKVRKQQPSQCHAEVDKFSGGGGKVMPILYTQNTNSSVKMSY